MASPSSDATWPSSSKLGRHSLLLRFDKQRLFYTQGDYGLFQCAKPCHQKTYDNEETIRKMIAAQGVETFPETSLTTNEYRITNLMGQTVQTGSLKAETQQIDVSGLPQGMYFISVGDNTRKFVVK